MPPVPSPWLLRAAELLADGEWHDYDAIIKEAALTVPPGRAKRMTERMRLRHRREPGEHYIGDHRRVHRTDDELIEYGARAIVSASVSGSVAFEISPRGTRVRDGAKQVRLAPGKRLWRGTDG